GEIARGGMGVILKGRDRDLGRELAIKVLRSELAGRAAAEQWKLRRMIDYCYFKSCLRRFILNYFGDRKLVANCGTCSNCAPGGSQLEQPASKAKTAAGTLVVGRSAGQRMPEPTVLDRFIIDQAPSGEELRSDLKKRAARALPPDAEAGDGARGPRSRRLNESEVLVVKKILSCVARLKNKFGKGTVAAVLRGSTSKQVLQNDLDKLSTYGLLKAMTQDEITAFIKALIEADCIAVEKGAYPTVGLTEFGREVMTGRADVALELPD
ncbi:MAG TPA: RQC domain-containing protein, partial [Blastocatellia bacterium]|nr:RQC domain-containing protein [Blastocatellia bacterium]